MFEKTFFTTVINIAIYFVFSKEFIAVESNEELNDMVDTLYLQANDSYAAYYIGVFFHLEEGEALPPNHLEYDLRFQKYWSTYLVYPYLQIPGPRNYTGLCH